MGRADRSNGQNVHRHLTRPIFPDQHKTPHKMKYFNALPELRAALESVDARPDNARAILRAAAPVLIAHGLPPVRAIGAVNQSAKTAKGEKFNIDQYTVYLAPDNSSGAGNTCPASTPGCRAACLNYAGRAAIEAKAAPEHRRILPARIARTVLYFASRPHFSAVLFNEVERARRAADRKGARFFVRLNGTSDISPRAFKVDGVDILSAFPTVSFFDYTKVWTRAAIDYGANYALCFSWTDGKDWETAHREILARGLSLAVPFAELDANGRPKVARFANLPTAYGRLDNDGRELFTVPVIDGDKFDARPLDRLQGGAPTAGGYIVGLRAKRTTVDGDRAAIASGFFVTV